ncbi:hypothetical protein ACQ4LE_004786 [Meloidogyne hapla]
MNSVGGSGDDRPPRNPGKVVFDWDLNNPFEEQKDPEEGENFEGDIVDYQQTYHHTTHEIEEGEIPQDKTIENEETSISQVKRTSKYENLNQFSGLFIQDSKTPQKGHSPKRKAKVEIGGKYIPLGRKEVKRTTKFDRNASLPTERYRQQEITRSVSLGTRTHHQPTHELEEGEITEGTQPYVQEGTTRKDKRKKKMKSLNDF